MSNKEIVFICRKCRHNLFADFEKLHIVPNYECPNCGEEGYLNWILSHIEEINEEKNKQ